MRRREFIVLIGAAAATWPVAARAQSSMPVIGFLHGADAISFAPQLVGFHQGLKEGGFIEGRNVTIEYRWAEGRFDQLPAMATDLVRRRVSVIAAVGGNNSNLAAKAATDRIPIVFSSGGDPIQIGLVTSLSRPIGNITGVSFLVTDLLAKNLGLLHEIVPGAKIVTLIVNPNSRESARQTPDAQEAAQKLGLELKVLHAGNAGEVDQAFAALPQTGAGALIIAGDPSLGRRIDQIIALAASHRIPAMYPRREFVAAGGLMSYGTNFTDAYRQVEVYVARILKGTKPADLPVVQAAKFDFVINLKTAKALGLELHPQLLARADEVIE